MILPMLTQALCTATAFGSSILHLKYGERLPSVVRNINLAAASAFSSIAIHSKMAGRSSLGDRLAAHIVLSVGIFTSLNVFLAVPAIYAIAAFSLYVGVVTFQGAVNRYIQAVDRMIETFTKPIFDLIRVVVPSFLASSCEWAVNRGITWVLSSVGLPFMVVAALIFSLGERIWG